jgi:hypothetical protein
MALAGDEILLLILSAFIGGASLIWWVVSLLLMRQRNPRACLELILIPFACAAFIFVALLLWADDEVRTHLVYIVILLALGIGWMGIATAMFRWLGLSLRDDAVDRNNPAARAAWYGGIIGVTLIYAGGNVGEGPSLWNNVYSAALGTIGLGALWLVLAQLFGASKSVGVDRDLASGLRLGGWATAIGLIFGRALAGNWESVSGTTSDFVREGWPAMVLTVAAAIVESVLRPSPRKHLLPWLSHGAIPAILYVIVASAWVLKLGHW